MSTLGHTDTTATQPIPPTLLDDPSFLNAIQKLHNLTSEDETLNAQSTEAQRQLHASIQRQLRDDDTDSDDSDDSSSDSDSDDKQVVQLKTNNNNSHMEELNETLQEAYQLTQDITTEQARLHDLLTRIYNVVFPKLSELVPHSVPYAQTVSIILDPNDPYTDELFTTTSFLPSDPKSISQSKADNLIDTHQVQQSKQERFCEIFNRNLALTISLELKNSSNHALLSRSKLTEAYRYAQLIVDLSKKHYILESFIRSRAMRIAPNLTALLRVDCSSKLLTYSKGLSQLVGVPSQHLISIGSSSNQSTAGFRKVYHQGILATCDLVRDVGDNEKRRRRALRLVSSKAALCIRQDFLQQSPQGEFGLKMRVEIERKMGVFQRSTQFGVRPLPRPDPIKKKRRGGRNARAWKERHGPTLLNKKQGMLKFGETEVFDEFTEESLGLLGQGSGTGNVRLDGAKYKVVDKKLEYQLKQRTLAGSSDQAVVATLFGLSKEAPLPDDHHGKPIAEHQQMLRQAASSATSSSSGNVGASLTATPSSSSSSHIGGDSVPIVKSDQDIEKIEVKPEGGDGNPSVDSSPSEGSHKQPRPIKRDTDNDNDDDDDDDDMIPPQASAVKRGGHAAKKQRIKLFD